MIVEYKKENNKIIRSIRDDFDKQKVTDESKKIVDVLYCGICGTDYQKYIGMDNVTEWGHEIIGKVEDSNSIVTIRTTYSCGKCNNCLSGHYEKCSNWSRLNFNGFSNKIVVNEKSIIDINDDFDIVYALVEPLYVANSLIKHIYPTNNSIYTIIGNGTIGLLSAFLIKKKYNAEVRIVGRRNPPSRDSFMNMINTKYYDFNNIEAALSGSEKIIITTPYSTIPNILKIADSYSNITFNGISKETCINIEMDKWHFKNLNIWPSFPHPQNSFEEEIKIIEENKEILRNIITNIYDLGQIEEAFHALDDKKQDNIKVLIKCKEERK